MSPILLEKGKLLFTTPDQYYRWVFWLTMNRIMSLSERFLTAARNFMWRTLQIIFEKRNCPVHVLWTNPLIKSSWSVRVMFCCNYYVLKYYGLGIGCVFFSLAEALRSWIAWIYIIRKDHPFRRSVSWLKPLGLPTLCSDTQVVPKHCGIACVLIQLY